MIDNRFLWSLGPILGPAALLAALWYGRGWLGQLKLHD